MADEQDQAEALDPTMLGEGATGGRDELPGLGLVDDERHRLNAEDLSVTRGSTETADSIRERDYRRDRSTDDPAQGTRLVEAESDVPTLADDEKDAVAEYVETGPADELSAEEAAVHVD